MKGTSLKTTILILAAGICLSGADRADAANSGAIFAASSSKSRTTAGSTQPDAPDAPARPSSMLERDTRLEQRLTLVEESTTIGEALAYLGRKTQVRLRAENAEIARAPLCLAFRDAPARDILDALAAVYGFEWRRDGGSGYVLAHTPAIYRLYLPKTESQRRLNQIGQEMARHAARLPQEEQQRLARRATGLAGDPKVRLSELPEPMQRPVRQMVEVLVQERQGQQGQTPPGQQGPFAAEQLEEATVRFSAMPMNGPIRFTRYWVSVGIPGASLGWYFTDYEQRLQDLKEGEGVRKTGAPPVYMPSQGVASRSAVAGDARLKQRVSLHLTRASLAQALHALAQKTSLSIAGHAEASPPLRRSFSVADVPLEETLDRLTSTYPGVKWELRKSGAVVVRRSGK